MALWASASIAIESPSNHLQSKAAQTATVKALQSINQDRWSLGERQIADTRDPLASKLYTWLMLTQREQAGSHSRLTDFIRKNPEWPSMYRLELRAEKDMPKSYTDAEIIKWFSDYKPRTGEGLIRYLGALTRAGKTTQAQSALRAAWPDIRLSRDEQKEIFQTYGRMIDRQSNIARFNTLLFSDQFSNARGLATVLGGGYPALAEARIALSADKGDVNALIAAVPADLRNDEGLLYERLRWRRDQDLNSGAIELLNIAPPASKMHNTKDWWRERHIIIRRLIEEKQYAEAYRLAAAHKQTEGLPYAQAEFLAGWLSLRFLNNSAKAYGHFKALHDNVSTPVSKSRAAYWAGRAAEDFKDKTISKSWYVKAAQYQTTYYGQLAAAKLGLEEKLPSSDTASLTEKDIENFKKNELIQSAKLFHVAGMYDEASTFMRAFTEQNKTPKAYRYSAELTANMKRYHDAVRIAKKASYEGIFLNAQGYPVINDRLARNNVKTEWALVHALIRQESVFDARIRSPAGALGLMQLMPATADETARKLGIAHQQSWLTLRPDHNIRLGSTYLDRMLARFDGSYPMAIAAYNAGPNRVDKWIKTFGDPRKGEVDWIDWIELIPIYETRNYVQRVLEGVYVYRIQLKGIQPTPNQPIHIALATN